jgi:hypothetical protein
MVTALIVAAAFLLGVIAGGIGGLFFVDETALVPRTDPGSFAEQEDFEVPSGASVQRELA